MGTRTHPKPNMWMLDCKDYVKELKNDSLLWRRRLRHLMPRPTTSGKGGPPSPFIASSYCNSICRTNTWSKEENVTEPLVSSRWNPTPEQLKALQEMYQRGIRTPSAEEIQLIAAKLRHFGKIEGKNVFYWFQNHKARERQKRRRQPDSFTEKNVQDVETLQKKETSLDWKCLDAEQNKKFVTSSNCSMLPKGSASMYEAAVTESRAIGWSHFDEKQQRQTSHRRRTAKGGNSLVDLSWMTPNYNQLNTINTSSASEETLGTAEEKQCTTTLSFKILSANPDEDLINQNGSSENQVLQLFPLRDDDRSPFRTTKTGDEEITTTINANITPNHFYEFL